MILLRDGKPLPLGDNQLRHSYVCGAMVGWQCDAVMLDANDIWRLGEGDPAAIQEWWLHMRTKLTPESYLNRSTDAARETGRITNPGDDHA